MEVMSKKGFKQTEVGLIPEDWNVSTVGELCIFINGVAHEKLISQFGNYTVVNSRFISTEGHVEKNCVQLLNPAIENDILMVMSDVPNGRAIAKCFLVNENDKYTVNQRICILRPYKANPNLLFYQINRNKYYLSFDDGVKQTNLRRDDVLSCPIPVPPNPNEQQAIATALSDVDELIANLDKLIEKKKAIKQGAMQELLGLDSAQSTTPRRRLPGFDGDWEEKTLGDCLSYEQPTKYLVSSSDYEGQSQTPVLTAGKSFILGYTDEKNGIYHDLPVIIFDDFTTSNHIVDFNFKVKSSAMKMLKPVSKEYDLYFIYSVMNQINFPLGDDHKRRWIAEYSNIDIFIPDFKEQKAIAQILSNMDAEIDALEAKKAKYQDIKQGMMQELLTGKTRLV